MIHSQLKTKKLTKSDFEKMWVDGIIRFLDDFDVSEINEKLTKFYARIHERIMSRELPSKNYQIKVTIDEKTCPQCRTINNFESNDLAALLDLLRHCERLTSTNGKHKCQSKVVSNRFTLES